MEGGVKNYFANPTYRSFPLPGELRKTVTTQTDDPCRQLPQEIIPVLSPEIHREYEKDAAATFAFVDTDAPLEDKLAQMSAMDRAYPGFGWGEARQGMEDMCKIILAHNKERYERFIASKKSERL